MSFNVGQTTAGASSGAFSGITANKITMPQAGVLQSVTIFWTGNAGVNFFLGVYADNAGVPGALLARSALSSTSGTTQTLAMTTNPTLANATSYWVAVQNQSNVNGAFDSGGGPGYFMGTPTWTGTSMQDPAPSGTTGAFTFSLFATFNPVTVTLHFAMAIADTSTVTFLKFRAGAHIPMAIADTSTVALGFHGVAAAAAAPPSVTNDPKRESRPIKVPPTGAGANQTTSITMASTKPPKESGPKKADVPPVQPQQAQIVTAGPKPAKESGPKKAVGLSALT